MGGIARYVFAALLCGAAPLGAQARAPIETDRPDFTESSATIPKGRWQLETGYTIQRAQGTSHCLLHPLIHPLVAQDGEHPWDGGDSLHRA